MADQILAARIAPLRCASCGSPAEEGASCCAACGAVLTEAALPAPSELAAPALTTGFQCQSCGAQVLCEPGFRSYACAFCGSTYVVELPGEGESRLLPEFVVPFRLAKEQASALFDDWCHRGIFTPRNVRQAARMDRMQGVYLPFWTFSMRAESQWRAEIGEHWHQGSGKNRVRRTEWHPLSGHHHSFHSFHLVSGSRGLPQDEAEAVYPFDLPAMRRYRPELLAGWLAEPFSVARETALGVCQQFFVELEGRKITAFLPGDTHRRLEWETRFEDVSDDLVLLPFWIGAYSYRGKTFRFVLNGQSGTATGTRPKSRWKIAAAALAFLTALLLFALFALSLTSGGAP